jgi:class 3 adenylate cyclase
MVDPLPPVHTVSKFVLTDEVPVRATKTVTIRCTRTYCYSALCTQHFRCCAMAFENGQSVCVTEALPKLPLPNDPVLAEWASGLNGAGHWADVFDSAWRLVFVTDEMRWTNGDTRAVTIEPIGFHRFSVEAMQFRASVFRGRSVFAEFRRLQFVDLGPYVLASTPGGREELRRVVDPELADLVDELEPKDPPAVWPGPAESATFGGVEVEASVEWFRIDDRHGRRAGYCALYKPAAGMSQLAALVYTVDLAHLARTRLIEHADRRPAAILMADLEASSPLARRLSTAKYFAFGRRLARAADQCVVDAGGIVGRHAGDGVVAFFLAETAGTESSAARSCIAAARNLRESLAEIAARSEISEADPSLRFGLHWGATLYIGRILTVGRGEVTALGEEVNEASRIEACATGGRALASKSLVERLNRADADALNLDPLRATYTPLADLATATDKARRDAPTIAVCEV